MQDYERRFVIVQLAVTLVDTFMGCEARERAKNCLQKLYPDARLAYFKDTTTLPYLAQPTEFLLYVKV